MPDYKTFGKRFAALRVLCGLNQREAGELGGVSAQTVSSWERDLKSPTMQAVCDIFSKHPGMRAGMSWVMIGDVYAQHDVSAFQDASKWSEAVYTPRPHLAIAESPADRDKEKNKLLEELSKVLEKHK